MANFTLTCCSTADRSKAFFDAREIPYACFHWQEGGIDHLDDLYQSMSPSEFYAAIKAGATPTTSQPGVGQFAELWEPIVAAGSDVLHKCMISMSACREDAERVRGLVEGAFPALAGKVEINDIGTVIGSHTGPGTVALFFMGDKRGE